MPLTQSSWKMECAANAQRRSALPQAEYCSRSNPRPGTMISTPVFGYELFVARPCSRADRKNFQAKVIHRHIGSARRTWLLSACPPVASLKPARYDHGRLDIADSDTDRARRDIGLGSQLVSASRTPKVKPCGWRQKLSPVYSRSFQTGGIEQLPSYTRPWWALPVGWPPKNTRKNRLTEELRGERLVS